MVVFDPLTVDRKAIDHQTQVLAADKSLIPTLVEGNYEDWSEMIMGLLDQHNLLGFVNGKFDSPASSSSTDSVNKRYASQGWIEVDQIVKGWIEATTDESVKELAATTSRDLWMKIKAKYRVPLGNFLDQSQDVEDDVESIPLLVANETLFSIFQYVEEKDPAITGLSWFGDEGFLKIDIEVYKKYVSSFRKDGVLPPQGILSTPSRLKTNLLYYNFAVHREEEREYVVLSHHIFKKGNRQEVINYCKVKGWLKEKKEKEEKEKKDKKEKEEKEKKDKKNKKGSHKEPASSGQAATSGQTPHPITYGGILSTSHVMHRMEQMYGIIGGIPTEILSLKEEFNSKLDDISKKASDLQQEFFDFKSCVKAGDSSIVEKIKMGIRSFGHNSQTLKRFLDTMDVSPLRLMESLLHVLLEEVDDKGYEFIVHKKIDIFSAAVWNDTRNKIHLLKAMHIFAKSNPEFLKEIAAVLEAFHVANVLDELLVTGWYEEGLAGGKDEEIWVKVKLFIDGLEPWSDGV